jgi:quercetin dioxygenase-like cupin family protein
MSGRTNNPMPESLEDLENEAALYALGVLDPQSLSRFEELLSRDAAAVSALKPYNSAAALVSESLDPVVPPPQIKRRLFEKVESAVTHQTGHAVPHGLGAVRSNEGKWKQAGVPGVTYKKLYFDEPSGLVTMLVRMEPGTVFPAHRHSRTEQCLVLEGDLIQDDHVYHPGDFTWAHAGSIDPMLRTEKGDLLLMVSGVEKEERV